MKDNLNILHIPDDTGYWLVRADGGKYYEDFMLNNFISVSDNEITIELIRNSEETSIAGATIDHYKEIYRNTFKDWTTQQISHGASRTCKFIEEIKTGDLVLVPSKKSTKFIIGVISSDPYEISPEDIESKVEVKYAINPYLKRRKVQWIKEVSRKELSEKLYWILSAHQTIFDLKEEKSYINQLLAPIYIQDDLCHCNLKISKSEGLDTDEWYNFYSIIKDVTKNSQNKVMVKSNVQSPGIVEIITSIIDSPVAMSVVGMLGGMIFTEVKIGDKAVKGIIPYFVNRKIDKEKMEHENRKIEIENMRAEKEIEMLEQEIKSKQIENIKKELEVDQLREQLQISAFNAGKEISTQTQMDSVDVVDEDKSEK